jgi:hypothetical protein
VFDIMRPRKHEGSRWKRWERYLDLASSVGSIAMDLREKPTPIHWLGMGLRAVGLVFRVKSEHREATARSPWRYFEDCGELDSRWVEIPSEFRKLVMEHVTEPRVEEDYWDGQPESEYVCLGKIGGEVVGWVHQGESNIADGPYVLAARERETYDALSERLWRRFGGKHLAYTGGGLVLDGEARTAPPGRVPASGWADKAFPLIDEFDDSTHVPTEQMREVQRRLNAFLAQGISRSCLFVGPPGTGKSMGVRFLVRALDLSSLRVDLAVLERHHGGADAVILGCLETLLKLLRPGALILDDLDRIDGGGRLLHFLELAVRTCKLVVATANCPDRMMGAALRPGRFDEIHRVERLDPCVLRRLLAPDVDLFSQLESLPVAYVSEFLKRRQALGRERALAELAEITARAASIDQKTDLGE